MPELPEVETVKEGLKKYYLDKVIKDVDVRYENILANTTKEDFEKNLTGQKIISFSRRGKFIIINLDHSRMLFHLRMEGKFKFKEELIDKHSHIIFYFEDGTVLIYHDVRKFGRIYYFNESEDIMSLEPLCKLGLEPWEINDPKYLLEKYKKDTRPIKSVLLDQSVICGIGNIYADEILFQSRISPLRKACKIKRKEAEAIISNACSIMKEAIKEGGTTIRTFQSQHGVDGMFQLHLKMYGMEGKPCTVCGRTIIKTKINQRGTCYCKYCQK